MSAGDHPAYRDPDCAGCADPFRGLPGVTPVAHTCQAHRPSTPAPRERYVGETWDDYQLHTELEREQ